MRRRGNRVSGAGRGWSENVGDVVDDVLGGGCATLRRSGGSEAVVPGLDRLDGALGAEGADGPPALGLLGSGHVEGDELGLDAGVVAVDGDQVVVGGVVALATGRGTMAVDMAAVLGALAAGIGPPHGAQTLV